MSPTTAITSLKDTAKEAYTFTLPLISMESFRRRCMGLTCMNQWLHTHKLQNYKSRSITAPNNDTLYSSAWVDLQQGPAILTLPPTGDRYFSVALLDMWSDNFAILSARTIGGEGGQFTILGPNASAEGIDGPYVRSPTPTCFVLVRILVAGPDDLPAVHAIQHALALQTAQATEQSNDNPNDGTRLSPWDEYFTQASKLMRLHRPRAMDEGVLRRIAALDLDTIDGFQSNRFSAAQATQIAQGVQEAKDRLGAHLFDSSVEGGWLAPRGNLGYFNQDYEFRARVSIAALAALTLDEATYFTADSFEGVPLDGRTPRLWKIPGNQAIPVNAFWSLTMYEATDDDELFFIQNPIDRYAIGDRTPGVTAQADGTLEIWIGHDTPPPAYASNWLPAPAGPYTLMLRAYLPMPALLDGSYQLPMPLPT